MMQQRMEEVNQELLKCGLVRYVGASFHSRAMARVWMRNLDVLMLRYNIAHLGVEQDVVPHLHGDKESDPGIVVFNTAHINRIPFHIPPTGYPAEQYVPTIPDCYRFALSHPWVDVVLTGLSTREQLDQAITALEKGPMCEEECQQMRQYGAFYVDTLK
jgi:predicted aldo/keto reductase-like oxidoreductase